MATPIFPAGTQAQGNVSKRFLQTVSLTAPTVAQVTATTAIDASCFLYEGAGMVDVDENKVDSQRRLCSRNTFQRFGNRTYSVGDLMYVYDQQAEDTTDVNKLYAALVPGSKMFLLDRFGLDAQQVDFAVGQFVDIIPVQLGERVPMADTGNEANEIQIKQPLIVTATPVRKVKIVA